MPQDSYTARLANVQASASQFQNLPTRLDLIERPASYQLVNPPPLEPSALDLRTLATRGPARDGDYLVKLKVQGHSNLEDTFVYEQNARLVERLALPGNPWQEQVVLRLQFSDDALPRVKANPRVCYVVPNNLYTLEVRSRSNSNGNSASSLRVLTRQERDVKSSNVVSTVIRSTDAAGLIRSITNAERLGTPIHTTSWNATRDNLALEDSLRRASHCLQIISARPPARQTLLPSNGNSMWARSAIQRSSSLPSEFQTPTHVS